MIKYKERFFIIVLVFDLIVSCASLCVATIVLGAIKKEENEESRSSLVNYTEYDLKYFYDPDCDYCQETTDLINKFIELGYGNAIRIELIDINTYVDSLDVVIKEIPMIVLLRSDKIKALFTGYEEIFNLLDDVVNMKELL